MKWQLLVFHMLVGVDNTVKEIEHDLHFPLFLTEAY